VVAELEEKEGDKMMVFDVRIQVLFCSKHKKVFEEKVKTNLSNNRVGIKPSELVSLWQEAETCLDCEWKTTFGKEEAETK